jgi:hypothetical protein
LPDKYWFVPVNLSMDTLKATEFIEHIESRLGPAGEAR